MKSTLFEWDIDHAVVAWKTLWLEAHTNQERAERVWQPTQVLLDKLADLPATTITCFAGKPYMFPPQSAGVAVNIFLTGLGQVVYLGTLLNQTAHTLDRQNEIDRLSIINPLQAQRLSATDPQAIVRDSCFCKIPSQTDELDTRIATQGVHRYLSIRAPRLASCAIDWLLSEVGISIEQRIRSEAEATANRPTREERLHATAEDELELWE